MNRSRWKIEYYLAHSGRSPVKEFIDNLTVQKEIKTALGRLRDYQISS